MSGVPAKLAGQLADVRRRIIAPAVLGEQVPGAYQLKPLARLPPCSNSTARRVSDP
jgi:hypothetical protein